MVNKIRHNLIQQKREGSSLVTVIIGILFLAAIGIIVLTVANQYFVSVKVDHNSSENFYSAEKILEEVKTGLLEYAGNAGKTAYEDVTEQYEANKTNIKKVFAEKYLGGIASQLLGHSYSWKEYEEQPAEDGSSGTIKVYSDTQVYPLEKLNCLTKVPQALDNMTNPQMKIYYDSKKGYSLTLKNIYVDYTDAADYQSKIRTDIRITVPDFRFAGDSTLDEVKDYIVITDDALKVNESANASFVGNVYTGKKETGIEIAGNGSNASFQSSTIISRGSMDIYGGSTVSLAGETGIGDLWLQNIHLKPFGADTDSTLKTKLNLKENAYIANDLNIEANNSEVTLGGKYYGYSYNKENVITDGEKKQSDYSSAILINGLNTTLKADDDLQKLILAGRTFVSRVNEDKSSSVSDIMMGESIAVKSNQLAYLLPDEYIIGEGGNSADGHNPVAGTESVYVDTASLLSGPIGKYLNQSQPFTKNYSNTGNYVFYYLNFKDEHNANEYFSRYYQSSSTDEDGDTISNKTQLEEKAKAYISSVDQDKNMKFDPSLYLVAGNVVENYYSQNGSNIQSPNYFSGSTPNSTLLEDGRRIGQDYVGRQLTLLSSGATGSMRMAEDAKTLVADNIIDFSKVQNEFRTTEETKCEGVVYVTKSSECTIDTSFPNKGIVIAEGDVTVSRDFEGLILAKGVVSTSGSTPLKSNMVLVGKLLDYIQKDKELSKIFYAFNGKQTQDPTKIEECIRYQNWVKDPVASAEPTSLAPSEGGESGGK